MPKQGQTGSNLIKGSDSASLNKICAYTNFIVRLYKAQRPNRVNLIEGSNSARTPKQGKPH